MTANIAFLVFPIEYSRSGMRYFQQIEQRCLLDLVLNTFIGMITGERLFTYGVKQFSVKCGWIIYFSGAADLLRFLRAVVKRFYSL